MFQALYDHTRHTVTTVRFKPISIKKVRARIVTIRVSTGQKINSDASGWFLGRVQRRYTAALGSVLSPHTHASFLRIAIFPVSKFRNNAMTPMQRIHLKSDHELVPRKFRRDCASGFGPVTPTSLPCVPAPTKSLRVDALEKETLLIILCEFETFCVDFACVSYTPVQVAFPSVSRPHYASS